MSKQHLAELLSEATYDGKISKEIEKIERLLVGLPLCKERDFLVWSKDALRFALDPLNCSPPSKMVDFL